MRRLLLAVQYAVRSYSASPLPPSSPPYTGSNARGRERERERERELASPGEIGPGGEVLPASRLLPSARPHTRKPE